MTKKTKSAIACGLLLLTTVYVTALQTHWGMAPYYGYDELWHTTLAALSPLWLSLLTISADFHPPLYYLLLRALTRIGNDPFFPRLLSIIPTILTLPLWYFLLRKLRINTTLALTTTILLAISFSFHHVGIMVRSYSLAVFLLLGAVWFWIDMLPGSREQPSRWSAVLSLALFTAAFWTVYVAIFVTTAVIGATLLVLLLDGNNRKTLLANWRAHSGWPEWLAFFLFHLLAFAWLWLGLHNHGNSSIPSHINQFFLAPEQPLLDYLVTGFRRELALFSPLFSFDTSIQDIGLVALLLIIVWFTIHSIRQGNDVAAVIALTPLLTAVLLAMAGLLALFPFGGFLRHQYVLFPFLLLLLALVLNVLWRALPGIPARSVLLLAVFAVAIHTSARTHDDNFYIGEAPPTPFWGEEFKMLFGHGSDTVIITPTYSFYATFMNRRIHGVHYRTSYQCDHAECTIGPRGFSTIFKPWPDFQEFSTHADDGNRVLFLRYRKPMISTRPSDAFFNKIRKALNTMEKTTVRIFSPEMNHRPNQDRDALSGKAKKHGFILTEFQPVEQSVIWSMEMLARKPDVNTPSPN